MHKVLENVEYLDLLVGRVNGMRGRCTSAGWLTKCFIERADNLPRLAIYEAQEEGTPPPWKNECFYDAIAYAWIGDERRSMLEAWKDTHLNKCVSSPVEVGQLAKFERGNKHLNMRLAVLFKEGNEIFPIYTSTKEPDEEEIDVTLLLYGMIDEHAHEDDKSAGYRLHYACIPNLDRFMAQQYRGNNGQLEDRYTHFWCVRCLNHFGSRTLLKNHRKVCDTRKPQKVEMPAAGSLIRFKEEEKRFPPCYLGFFDFE